MNLLRSCWPPILGYRWTGHGEEPSGGGGVPAAVGEDQKDAVCRFRKLARAGCSLGRCNYFKDLEEVVLTEYDQVDAEMAKYLKYISTITMTSFFTAATGITRLPWTRSCASWVAVPGPQGASLPGRDGFSGMVLHPGTPNR